MMSGIYVTHVGFSDESNWNQGRFRSLGLVTTSLEHLEDLENKTRELLQISSIKEFKWKKLDGAKERYAAIKLCQLAIKECCQQNLRIDVLIWDIEDRRHKIPKRDDIANLQRMYYHLFRNVLRVRWPDNAIWRLHPHKHTAMDWDTVRDCLENVSTSFEIERSLFTGNKFKVRLRHEFGIDQINPASPNEHPTLQLSDLFAGLACFSHEKFDLFARWERNQFTQGSLFCDEDDETAVKPSRISKERFKVLCEFNRACKARKFGVSLKEKKGLWTPKPANPINFWIYKPQHPLDRAPLRG